MEKFNKVFSCKEPNDIIVELQKKKVLNSNQFVAQLTRLVKQGKKRKFPNIAVRDN